MAATSSEKPTVMLQDTVDITDVQGLKNDESASGGMKPFLRIFSFGTLLDSTFQIIGGLCAIGSGTALPLMTIVFGRFTTGFIDFGSGRSTPAQFRQDVNQLTLYFVYLFVGKFVLSYVSTALFMISALRITSRIRSQFVKATLRQEIAYFDDVGPGSIAVKATTNANHINTGIAEKFSKVIQSVSMIATALIIGLTQSWKLSLIIIAAVFPLFVILSITMTYDANIEVKLLRIYSKASNLAEEILGSIKTVRAFEANTVLLKKYEGWLVKAYAVSGKKSTVYAIMFGGEFFFGYMPYALAFWQGARMYLAGDLASVGKLITVVFSVLMISAGIGQIAPSITSFIQASSAAHDLFQTLDRKPLLDSSSNEGHIPTEILGHIEFQNVSFSYPSRPHIPILRDISFDVPANKVTALVGASGSGKSTVVSLLERWYEPGSGDILIDGHKINELNVKWLRNNMRLVQQEPVLFNDTIFNNIIQGLSGSEHEFASHEVKMKLVKEACCATNAADFIEDLDEGYHTHVGEGAGQLSGGQKQRIAIARSIISDPCILLLDEATSALDAHSETIVQDALGRVSKSRTTIVIAHKLATVMKADNIIVVGEGKILEQGTHQELLRRNGAYATLVHAQQLGNSLSVRHEEESSVDDDVNIKEIIHESMENKITTVKSWSQSHPDTFGSRDLNLLRILITFVGENGKHWQLYTAVVFFSIIGGGIYPAQAVLLSKLIVAFEPPQDKVQADVNLWALMFFILSLAALGAYGVLAYITNVISQILTKRYRYEMLESLMRQDISFFDKPENAGATLASRLSTDPAGLQDFVGMNIALIIVVIVNLVSNAVLATCLACLGASTPNEQKPIPHSSSIVYGWKLALVVFFGALPLIFSAGFIRIRLESQLSNKNSASFADTARFASEAVGAMRTVCSFTIEDSISAVYDKRLQVSLKRSIKHVFQSMIFYALTESVQFLGMALAFWYGGGLLASGEYTTNQFFVIYTAIIFGGEAASMFFSWTTNIVKAHSGGNYILKLRHSHALISNDPNAKQPDSEGDYTFDKVHFRYPLRKNVPVLQGLDLKIKSGSSVAFVGGSGCGKSTTIGLLERYYDPSYGDILLGGDTLPDLQLSKYRSLISLVSQEPTLYQGSIRENIAVGATHSVTEEQIINAAKEANIFDFISSLPEGLATDCGSRGMQLSGGQKQRIAIARALVRDPKIILLDEATSALDTSSEKLVQESLNNASRGRTTISVAHRLSTIRDCDKIFVFDGGIVAESGTHQELLALNGRYKKLCEAQSLDQSS